MMTFSHAAGKRANVLDHLSLVTSEIDEETRYGRRATVFLDRVYFAEIYTTTIEYLHH
jgi:hypothetical protein